MVSRTSAFCAYIKAVVKIVYSSACMWSIFRSWLWISDVSIYGKYRYVISISIYRIVSNRPPQCRYFRYIAKPNFVLEDRFYIDSDAGNREFI